MRFVSEFEVGMEQRARDHRRVRAGVRIPRPTDWSRDPLCDCAWCARPKERHPFFWSFIAGAITWAALLLGPQTCFGQAPVERYYSDTMVTDTLSHRDQYHGAVTCEGGVPVIEALSLGIRDSLRRAEAVRHEAMHFVQLAAGDCEMTLVHWGMSPLAWLDAEAEAFCTGISFLAGVGDGITLRAQRITEYVNLLRFRRPPGLNPDDVGAAIDYWCGS